MLAMACWNAGTAQSDGRTLTGTVYSKHHRPLKGAVVAVENESNHAVETYLSDGDGRFIFRRLSSDADYRVTATYQGSKARPHEMSHFDSKANRVLHFTIQRP